METRHTFILPSREPEASMSPSSEKATARTASSCIMSNDSAWYVRSIRSFPVSQSYSSTKPSEEPTATLRPSGDAATASAWFFLPSSMTALRSVG